QDCCVCSKSGAAITCCAMGCGRSLHLPCATKGGCVTQYHPHYRYLLSPLCQLHLGRSHHFSPSLFPLRAFCSEHSPVQVMEAVPEKGTTCLICLEKVDSRKSFHTLVCPACKHAWFHRHCIQGLAVQDGFTGFGCPHCREKDMFRREMKRVGIRIPFR
ncbi:G2E3 ligase, partial [Alcedo cyanopectus]|nr:G2E3 ligase [Ceyx cyanopectus]